jgi:nucleoside-diphosphate-sugar epimerase
MKRVLVTGARGFVGSSCVPLLEAAGYEIHAVTSRPPPSRIGGSVVWHRLNLLEPGKVSELIKLEKPTHLLHLAWITEAGKYWATTENLSWVAASLNLLKVFQESGGERAVIAGTCAEYDWAEGVCSESHTPLRPTSLYGICKHALQCIASAFAVQSNLSLAWARIFFTYGPAEPESKLVSSVVRSLLTRQTVNCSPGNQKRDFIYIGDTAAALTALMESPVTGPVNIASGAGIAVRDVVLKLSDLLQGHDLVQFEKAERAEEVPLVVADVGRLSGEVGWQPRYDMDAGLLATVEWWKDRLKNSGMHS